MSIKSKLMLKSAQSTVLCIPPALAAEIGLNNAMVLMQIAFWIRTSHNYRDGRWWTFQSTRGMQQKAFPFWSYSTINRAINSLLERGLLLAAGHNSHSYDRTRWLALNESGIAQLQSVSILPLTASETENTPCQSDTAVFQNDTPVLQSDTANLFQDDTTLLQNEPPFRQIETHSTQNETTIPESPTEIKDKKIKDSFAPADAAVASETGVDTDTDRPESTQVDPIIQSEATVSQRISADADRANALKEIPHTDKIALIRAWWESLPAQPATVDNPYNRKPWHKQAETLIQSGLTAEDVRRFVSTKTTSGQFYHDKHLPWARVASDLPAWVAQHPAAPTLCKMPVVTVPRNQHVTSDGERLATPAEIAAARKAFDQLVAQYRGIKS